LTKVTEYLLTKENTALAKVHIADKGRHRLTKNKIVVLTNLQSHKVSVAQWYSSRFRL